MFVERVIRSSLWLLQFLDTATEIDKYDSAPRARSNVIEKHSESFAVRVNVRGCS